MELGRHLWTELQVHKSFDNWLHMLSIVIASHAHSHPCLVSLFFYTILILNSNTAICYLFGVEIFSDCALHLKFCYPNIFPTIIFFINMHAHTHMQNARKARRRTSIFLLLLPKQDQPRMSIVCYFKPPLPLYERESLLTHTRPRLSHASL